MSYRPAARLACQALLIASVAAAATAVGGAGSARPAMPTSAIGGQQTGSTSKGGYRYVRRAGSRARVAVTGPTGCTANGKYSFVGELGPLRSQPETNWAGGTTSPSGGLYDGVVAGVGNEGCDLDNGIVAGGYNVVGGDGATYADVVVGGFNNGIEAVGSFIGGGSQNLIGLGSGSSSYIEPYDAAVVAGDVNTATSNYSAIAAGYSNSIVTTNQVDHGPSDFIGAGVGNSISAEFASILGGAFNSVSGEWSGIGDGSQNSIASGDAAIVGGRQNVMQSNATYGFIGAGDGNQITSSYASIAGGNNNYIGAQYAVIGGGNGNIINKSESTNGQKGLGSTIGGGADNSISSTLYAGSTYATVAGGENIAISGSFASIGGGDDNAAGGKYAIIPGGYDNVANGTGAFAAGSGAKANNSGSFVWSDEHKAPVVRSTGNDQFIVRSIGGVWFYSSLNLSTGVTLPAGSGSWSSLSDRASKTAVAPIDGASILDRVASLPISEWSYSAQRAGVRHLGPMAQDFHAAFGLGEDDRHISAIDEDGVALAAIKALQAEVQAKDRRLAVLEQQQRRLESRLDALAARLRINSHAL